MSAIADPRLHDGGWHTRPASFPEFTGAESRRLRDAAGDDDATGVADLVTAVW